MWGLPEVDQERYQRCWNTSQYTSIVYKRLDSGESLLE